MSPSNAVISNMLRQYATLLAVTGANRFKQKAYRRAAEIIEGLGTKVTDLVEQGKNLRELPGIGPAIDAGIREIVSGGKLKQLDRELARLPPETVELASRPGLDAKKVARVYKKLGIHSLAELKVRLEDGSIGKALGARMEYHVRQGLDDRPRSLLYDVSAIAQNIEAYLRTLPSVTNASRIGSLRRQQDTIGDLGFLVAAKSAAPLFRRFSKFSAVLSSQQRGAQECAYELSSGHTVTLHWTKPGEWGLALLKATRSSRHLADLEARAASKKLSLEAAALGHKVDLGDERNVYAALKLDFIEPELREGHGEVAAASAGKLPRLVEIDDMRGDLHMHTTKSDGANSVAEMAAAARSLGYEYIAISDHSQSLKITNGLSPERLIEHIRGIDKINSRLKGFRVLKSAEVDILENGKLDYANSLLKELDFTICSIHSRFALNREQQTERILRAMDNRYFTILGHATGRLLLRRPGYELDMDRLIKHARETGCFFEINSSPDRLDLSDEHARLAKQHGVKIAINTDAHSTRELRFISAGIHQARRGWLEAADVLNTLSLKPLLGFFKR